MNIRLWVTLDIENRYLKILTYEYTGKNHGTILVISHFSSTFFHFFVFSPEFSHFLKMGKLFAHFERKWENFGENTKKWKNVEEKCEIFMEFSHDFSQCRSVRTG